MNKKIPAYIDFAVIPLANIMLAFIVSGVIISFTGENPLQALVIMLQGAFGYPAAIGYTLYYTTNFIFTGLAAAVAFRASLFNIGAEGQAYLGVQNFIDSLGVAVVMLSAILSTYSTWYFELLFLGLCFFFSPYSCFFFAIYNYLSLLNSDLHIIFCNNAGIFTSNICACLSFTSSLLFLLVSLYFL